MTVCAACLCGVGVAIQGEAAGGGPGGDGGHQGGEQTRLIQDNDNWTGHVMWQTFIQISNVHCLCKILHNELPC